MTTIQRLSREDAVAERDSLLSGLRSKYGTEDRSELRELSFYGAMGDGDIEAVERVRSLDFLLSE